MDGADKEINKQGNPPKPKVLRINDIIPPFDKKPQKSQPDKAASMPIMSAAPVAKEEIKADVPKFNLAEDIMAEQRRLSANKRVAPIGKIPIQQITSKGAAGRAMEMPIPEDTEIDEIITQIVSKDLERLYASV